MPPPSLFYSPPHRWVVGALTFDGSNAPAFVPITFLDRRCIRRSEKFTLNAPAQATGTVFGDDPEINIVSSDGFPFVDEGVRCLWDFRRDGATSSVEKPWRPRWAGLILQVNDIVENDVPLSVFTGFDPWMYLYNRAIRKADGSLPGPAGQTFLNQRGSDIAKALLTHTNDAVGDCFIDMTSGTVEDTDRLDITFQQASTVGEAWTQLCDTNSMDIILTPIYDPENRPGKLVELNIYQQAGTRRHGAIFAWDRPSRSLVGVDRLHDGTKRANRVQYFVPNNIAVPPVFDSVSVDKYGPYEGQTVFPVQAATVAVEGLEAADIIVRANGEETIRVDPVPERSPVPFIEYFLGDSVPVYASKRLRKPLAGYYRVYEIPLEISDDSLETVSQLEFSLDSADVIGPGPDAGSGGMGSGGGGGFGAWAWDARSASLDPDSAALVADWLTYSGPRAYFDASVATADAVAGSPGYAIPGSGAGGLDPTVYIPLGTRPGVSNDRHLTVRDVTRSREHDLYLAVYDSVTGRISSCSGGSSFEIDAVQEPVPGNSNAARFPLRRGLITPADVALGFIAHPLVFSCDQIGVGPPVYPANTIYGGAYPGHLTFGAWLRLDPAVDVDLLAINHFEKLICHALQNYGMFLRDGGGLVAIQGADRSGGASNNGDWSSVGVTLNPADANSVRLSSNIPWASMQLLQPPTP